MTELSESAGSGARRTGPGGGASGPEAPDRPKLVAVPLPEVAPEPAPTAPVAPEPEPDAVPAAAPAEPDRQQQRLALERALRGPAGSGAPGVWPAATASTAESRSAEQGSLAADLTAPDGPPTAELVAALRAELAMRATAEAGLRARVVDAETRLAARAVLSQRTAETLREVRAELDRLVELVATERSRRETAERRAAELEAELAAHRGRSADADREIASLSGSLEQLRTPGGGSPVTAPAADHAAVEPDRLSDALSRLRANAEPRPETVPAPLPATATAAVPAASTRPAALPAAAMAATLAGPFRTLTRRDPALAGRLALSLLGLERVAYPHPISFDLVLGPGRGCVQVTSSASRTDVVGDTTARPLDQVGFRVVGGPDRLARLLVAGRLRRRLGFGVARVRGDRDGLAALDALLALPLDLPMLVDGGMLSDPTALLSLVAAIVRPEWTRGAHFALSHRDGDAPPTYLRFAGGRRPEVTPTAPAGPIATVISCAEHDLASVLTGATVPGSAAVQVAGDTAPLQQLQGWIKRAQSG
jgi:hypothetical protein